jgi:hypothetical protein
MQYYKLKFKNGDCKIVKGKNDLEIIKKYDLATKEHISTRIVRLEGEQLAIVIANE